MQQHSKSLRVQPESTAQYSRTPTLKSSNFESMDGLGKIIS